MDHRSRSRGMSHSRVPGSQIRAPRVPLPFHVEQEAREGEETEREVPRQRPTIYVPPETEELQETVMSKYILRGSWGLVGLKYPGHML